MDGQRPPFYGKYRGIVTDNQDPPPTMRGRIRAKVLDVYGDQESPWAMPSSPYAGDNVGLFLIPPVGANVWMEFEHGDPDYPIWSGCFWSEGQVPNFPLVSPNIKILKTDFCTIMVDDTPGKGGLTIKAKIGTIEAKIVMDATGIDISGSSKADIKLSPLSVSINSGALEVT